MNPHSDAFRDAALVPDALLDADHPLLMRHVHDAVRGATGWDRAAQWYDRVRDGIRYNPWRITFAPASLQASRILEEQEGHCVAKSVLFAAGLRVLGIPAVLGYASVRNHLATEALEAKLGTDLLVPHGYVAFWNGERWTKSTPVFNATLCAKLGVPPLPFSASSDQLFQAHHPDGSAFMRYEEDFGLFLRPPLEQLRKWFVEAYPHIDPERDFS